MKLIIKIIVFNDIHRYKHCSSSPQILKNKALFHYPLEAFPTARPVTASEGRQISSVCPDASADQIPYGLTVAKLNTAIG